MSVSLKTPGIETRANTLQGLPQKVRPVNPAALFLCPHAASGTAAHALNLDGGVVFY
jgi:hypothetical protein